MLEEKAYAKDIDELRAKLGLDRPIYVQYFEWLGRVVRGDLGESLWTRRARARGARRGACPSRSCSASSPSPSPSSSRSRRRHLRRARRTRCATTPPGASPILGLSVPGFWLATLVIVLPAIWWGWRPAPDFTEFSRDPVGHVVPVPAARRAILGIALGRRDHAADPRHAPRGAAPGLRADGVGQGARRARRRVQAQPEERASSRSSRCSASSSRRSSAAR